MSFYPLFNIHDALGFVRLANFSPNSWEKVPKGPKMVYAFRTDGTRWLVDRLGSVQENVFQEFEAPDFSSLTGQDADGTRVEELVLLELRTDALAAELGELPPSSLPSTHWPEWRATVGFKSRSSRVSYQGEINPTPPKASLLSFHPFIQFTDIRNYFVFVNLERLPSYRWSEIEIYLPDPDGASTCVRSGTMPPTSFHSMGMVSPRRTSRYSTAVR